MKKATLVLAVVAAVVAALAASAPAAPKPGFLPGTWKGVGTISGKSVDGPLTTVFTGKMSFTLKVAPSYSVGGSGVWSMTMKGSGPIASKLSGSAPVTLSGSSVAVRFTGQQKVSGVVSDGAQSRPIGFTRPLAGKLVITRAGTCRVTGTSPMGAGVRLTWTAVLAGSGTCRA